MRKCCCCISVHVGSVILGFIGLMLCALELVVILPYLFNIDEKVFNPIKKNEKEILYHIEDQLKGYNITPQQVKEYVNESTMSTALLGFAIEAGVYSLCCLLMMIGASCRIRGLMIPYLVVQMFCIIVMMVCMVALTVFHFLFGNLETSGPLVIGIVSAGVTLVISTLIIYFWVAVQRAFVELGNNDYMYSPAPIKPVGVGHYDGRGHADHHYPTSPQHFPMDERH